MKPIWTNVNRSRTDGRLMASSFELSYCPGCDGAHFDLRDKNGDVFATAIIPSEAFLAVAAKFCAFDEHGIPEPGGRGRH